MIPGVSTACFYPLETEQSLDILTEHSVSAIEVFLNAPSEYAPDFLNNLKNNALGRGCSILSLHPFSSAWEPMLLFSNYPRRNQDGFDMYRRYFEGTALLGAKIMVLHGAYRWQSVAPDFYFQQYGALFEMGQQFGVTLAQENVVRFKCGDLSFLKEMRRQLPFAKFVLDTKQALRSETTPELLLDVLGDALCHVHISDHNVHSDCVLMGDGDWDYTRFLRRLREMNYQGGVIQEVYQDSYKHRDEVLAGYENLRAAIRLVKEELR